MHVQLGSLQYSAARPQIDLSRLFFVLACRARIRAGDLASRVTTWVGARKIYRSSRDVAASFYFLLFFLPQKSILTLIRYILFRSKRVFILTSDNP